MIINKVNHLDQSTTEIAMVYPDSEIDPMIRHGDLAYLIKREKLAGDSPVEADQDKISEGPKEVSDEFLRMDRIEFIRFLHELERESSLKYY